MGWILEVAIHQDDGIAVRRLETGGESRLVAEVPGKLHHSHAGIIALKIEQHGQRRIAAAVVYVNNFPTLRCVFQHGNNSRMKRSDIFFFVVNRDYD